VDLVDSPAWWGDPQEPPRARSIVELLRAATLDAELAALLWLLVEGRVPIVVAGQRASGRTTLLTALLEFLPHQDDRLAIATADEAGVERLETAATGTVILLPELLRGAGGIGQRGALARAVMRALSRGATLATTISGARLEDVYARLRGPSAGVKEDELTFLGAVVVMAPVELAAPSAAAERDAAADAATTSTPPRVVAAHYVRPLARDAHGHVQRLGPAVLATRDAAAARFEHFGWGIYPELATRIGIRAGDLEREHARRTAYLAGLADAGVATPAAVRSAIDGYRHAAGHPAT
jgi:hypothetical protein